MPRIRGRRRAFNKSNSQPVATIGIDASDDEYGNMPEGVNCDHLLTTKRKQKNTMAVKGRSCSNESNDSNKRYLLLDISKNSPNKKIKGGNSKCNSKMKNLQIDVSESDKSNSECEFSSKKSSDFKEVKNESEDEDFSKFDESQELKFDEEEMETDAVNLSENLKLLLSESENEDVSDNENRLNQIQNNNNNKKMFIIEDSDSDICEINKNFDNGMENLSNKSNEIDNQLEEDLKNAQQFQNKIGYRGRSKKSKNFLRKKDEVILKRMQKKRTNIQFEAVENEYFNEIINLFNNSENAKNINSIEDFNCEPTSTDMCAVFTIILSGERKYMKLNYEKPFTTITAELSKILQIPQASLALYNGTERIDLNNWTPMSKNLTDGATLDLDIVKNDFENKGELENDTMIRLKFRVNLENKYHEMPFRISYSLNLDTVMKEIANTILRSIDELIFRFDGDVINGKQTPEELDLDDDDVIEVIDVKK